MSTKTTSLTVEQKRALIAEEYGWTRMVIGLNSGASGKTLFFCGSSLQGTPPRDREKEEDDQAFEPVPDYFFDANAALALCDAMAKEGWNCHLGNGLDKTWECEFQRPPTAETQPDDIGSRADERLEIIYGSGDTLPIAICEAFAKAKGLWQ